MKIKLLIFAIIYSTIALHPNEKVLPSNIKFEQINDELFKYHINKAYVNYEEKDFDYIYEFFPKIHSIDFCNVSDGFSFTTYEELKTIDLENLIDELAYSDGIIPYWAEIVLLDLKIGTGYKDDNYVIEIIKEDNISQYMEDNKIALADFIDVQSKLNYYNFNSSENTSNSVIINPIKSLCMCHDSYSIRIVDGLNNLNWIYSDHVSGDLKVLLQDYDLDSFIIYSENHGIETLFKIVANI